MKKQIITAIGALVIFSASGQDFQADQKAFRDSYSNENAKLYDRAAENIRQVYNDKSYEMNLRMGWLMYLQGKYIESQKFYEKAIALEPRSIEAKFGLVYPLAAGQKWDDVLRQYENILQIDPFQPTTLYRVSLIHYNRGSFAQAKKYADSYMQIYPFNFDGLSLAGWIELKMGNKSAAKTYFERALLHTPDDKTTLEGLTLCK
ncbi:MAG: tetratricopeptide repeat protein [Chitinophagales bacterium]